VTKTARKGNAKGVILFIKSLFNGLSQKQTTHESKKEVGGNYYSMFKLPQSTINQDILLSLFSLKKGDSKNVSNAGSTCSNTVLHVITNREHATD
jgi:hypothetical protein